MKRLALLLLVPLALIAAAPFDPFNEARIDGRPGAQVPLDLAFTDQNGKNATLRARAAGKPIVLVPVLHDCRNICGIVLRGLGEAVAQQPFKAGRDMTLVAFGIDPAETPADAAADRAKHPALPASFLVGTEPDVRAVTDSLGYRYAYDPRICEYAHVSATAVLTADGKLVRWVNGIAPEPADLSRAIADAKQGRTSAFAEAIALLCYHYDPETGRYSVAITRVLKAAAALTVLLLAGTILFLRRKAA